MMPREMYDIEREMRRMANMGIGIHPLGQPFDPYGNQTKIMVLEFEGLQAKIGAKVPNNTPRDYLARQFADQVYRLLRDFPSGWSGSGSYATGPSVKMSESNQQEESDEQSTETDKDRFGAAFE